MATIAYNGIIYGNDTVELTKAEYDALGDKVLTDGITYFITDAGTESESAKDITFSNTVSGLNSVNVQDAIDELAVNGSGSVDLTMAEYEALEAEGKVSLDTTYYITDASVPGGSVGNVEIPELTQAEYDALPENEKENGIYVVTDGNELTAENIECKDVDGNGSTVQTEIDKLNNNIDEQNKNFTAHTLGTPIDITTTTAIITPADGYLVAYSGGGGSDANAKWVTVEFDDTFGATFFSMPNWGGTTLPLFVKKGTKLKLGSGTTGGSAKFYPFIYE